LRFDANLLSAKIEKADESEYDGLRFDANLLSAKIGRRFAKSTLQLRFDANLLSAKIIFADGILTRLVAV
tara:strand:- start:1512 stop:1721 length:210 start_codon:yes stop_codon:yes gene_type:complete